MREHLLTNVRAALDQQNIPVFTIHGIRARCFGQIVDQGRVKLRRQVRAADNDLDGVADGCSRQQLVPALPEIPEHLRIRQGAVTIAHGDVMARQQGIKAVAVMFGKQFARKFDGAQIRCSKIDTEAFEFTLEEGVVKTGVVRDKKTSLQLFKNEGRQLLKAWRRGNHRRSDSGQPGDEL